MPLTFGQPSVHPGNWDEFRARYGEAAVKTVKSAARLKKATRESSVSDASLREADRLQAELGIPPEMRLTDAPAPGGGATSSPGDTLNPNSTLYGAGLMRRRPDPAFKSAIAGAQAAYQRGSAGLPPAAAGLSKSSDPTVDAAVLPRGLAVPPDAIDETEYGVGSDESFLGGDGATYTVGDELDDPLYGGKAAIAGADNERASAQVYNALPNTVRDVAQSDVVDSAIAADSPTQLDAATKSRRPRAGDSVRAALAPHLNRGF